MRAGRGGSADGVLEALFVHRVYVGERVGEDEVEAAGGGVRVVVVADGLLDVAFEAVDREVHAAEVGGGGRQVGQALGVRDIRIVEPGAAPRGGGGGFGLGAVGGEAQEDETEEGRGVFLSLQFGIGAELVGGSPKLSLKGGGGSAFLRGGDPLHAASNVRK